MLDTIRWQVMLVALAGWVNRHQLEVITYLREENRVLKEQIGARRLRFTDPRTRRRQLKPTAAESSPPQSSDDCRAAAHDVPEQAGPIILDHQHDRPLIDSEVIGRDPPASRAVLNGERLIERRLETVHSLHSQIHLRKMLHRRDNDFSSKRL